MIYTKSPLPKVDKVIEKLYEDLIKYKNKIYVLGPKDEQGRRPIFRQNRLEGYVEPDDSINFVKS